MSFGDSWGVTSVETCAAWGAVSFVAKYDSTCPLCSDPIKAGQEIQTHSVGRYERYEHVACPRTADVTCSICEQKWVECGCP